MPESKPSCSTPGNKKASIAVAQVSGAQWGVIGAQQLLHCGIGRTSISRWRRQGRLHQLLPGVYAVGHPSVSTEGWLVAALIHAGPGAALSHATAAWWWGLIPKQPARIEVSTLARARSVGPVAVHHPRQLEIVRHRRFPVTTVARTLLDFAAEAGASQVRRALSEADYLGLLDLPALRATVGGGQIRKRQPGTGAGAPRAPAGHGPAASLSGRFSPSVKRTASPSRRSTPVSGG